MCLRVRIYRGCIMLTVALFVHPRANGTKKKKRQKSAVNKNEKKKKERTTNKHTPVCLFLFFFFFNLTPLRSLNQVTPGIWGPDWICDIAEGHLGFARTRGK